MVSFREFRELQRIKDNANMGPGATEYSKPFGSDIHHKMHFGGKYKWKPSDTPPPGLYEADKAQDAIKPKAPSAKIVQPP